MVNYFMLAERSIPVGKTPDGKKYLTKELPNEIYRLLKFNLFSNKIEFTRSAPWHRESIPNPEWTDADTVGCRVWLAHNHHIDLGNPAVDDAALVVARFYAYHPVKNWFDTLKWDGIPRLDNWLIRYCGADSTNYVRQVGKCTLMAAVARILFPGCQHDSMLILEGEQGSGKTSVVRILGGLWYADVLIDPHHINTVHGMLGSWIMEASELEFAKRAEISAMKRFLTLTSDKVRLSYARHSEALQRQNIWIGTINPGKKPVYLNDTDGNRRFWPVLTRTIHLNALERDREQLFAEALFRVEAGEAWHLDYETEKEANKEAMRRVAADLWEEVIEEYIASEMCPAMLTSKVIAFQALGLSAKQLDLAGRGAATRIANCMHALGYANKRAWDRNRKVRVNIWSRDDDESDLDGV
jgi:putative DNA primase/helicase